MGDQASHNGSAKRFTFRLLAESAAVAHLRGENPSVLDHLPIAFEWREFHSSSELCRELQSEPTDIVVLSENFPRELLHVESLVCKTPLVVRVGALTSRVQLEATLDETLRKENLLDEALLRLCSYSRCYSTDELSQLPPFFAAERLHASGLLSEDELFRLRLLFQEVIANAIEHGNLELQSTLREQFLADGQCMFSALKRQRLQDPRFAKRNVEISSGYLPSGHLSLRVRNDGPGFDYVAAEEALQNTRKLEGRTHFHGRGLHLIYNLADTVQWDVEGRVVTLHIRFGAGRSKESPAEDQ